MSYSTPSVYGEAPSRFGELPINTFVLFDLSSNILARRPGEKEWTINGMTSREGKVHEYRYSYS